MRPARAIVAGLCLVAAACRAGGIAPPAVWEPGLHACSFCRMTVVDRRFASQLVVPYEEPRFFDDMGCLSNYLSRQAALPAAAVVYVADHRTGAWIPAHAAVYTRVDASRRRWARTSSRTRRLRRARATRRPPAARRWSSATSFRPGYLEQRDDEPHQTEIDVWLCARLELVLSARSRWIQTFAAVFAGLAIAVASSGIDPQWRQRCPGFLTHCSVAPPARAVDGAADIGAFRRHRPHT